MTPSNSTNPGKCSQLLIKSFEDDEPAKRIHAVFTAVADAHEAVHSGLAGLEIPPIPQLPTDCTMLGCRLHQQCSTFITRTRLQLSNPNLDEGQHEP